MSYPNYEVEPRKHTRLKAGAALAAQLSVGFVSGVFTIAGLINIPDAHDGTLAQVEGLPAADFVNSNELANEDPNNITTTELLFGIAGNMAINGCLSKAMQRNFAKLTTG